MALRLSDFNDEELWRRLWIRRRSHVISYKYLVELHRRGTRETFCRAIDACKSADPHERILGVRVLRELGGAPPIFADEILPVLVTMLPQEHSPRVRKWLISALSYQVMENLLEPNRNLGAMKRQALSAILPFANDRNALVRFEVAAVLPGLVDLTCPDDSAVKALTRLASDSKSDTRYYALSGLVDDLGLAVHDNVRVVLAQRLSDRDKQIRQCAQRALEEGKWADS